MSREDLLVKAKRKSLLEQARAKSSNPVVANDIAEKGILFNATPEEAESIRAILPQEDIDMQEYIAVTNARSGTNLTMDMAQANLVYEYGEGATAATANAANLKAAKHQKAGVKEFFGTVFGGVQDVTAAITEAAGQALEPMIGRFAFRKDPDDWKPTKRMLELYSEEEAREIYKRSKEAHESQPRGKRKEMVSEIFTGVAKEIIESKPEWVKESKRILEEELSTEDISFVKRGASLVALNAPNLVASANALIGLPVMYSQERKSMDDALRDAGLSVDARDKHSATYGAVSGAIEYIETVGRLKSAFGGSAVKSSIRKKIVKKLASVGINVTEEVAQQLVFNIVYNDAVSKNNEATGNNVALKKLPEGLGDAAEGSLAMTLVLEALGLSIKGASVAFTLGDGNRIRKQNTNEEIDTLVEEMDIPAEKKPLVAEMLDNPTEQNTEAVNAWEAEEITTPEGEPVVLGEGFSNPPVAEREAEQAQDVSEAVPTAAQEMRNQAEALEILGGGDSNAVTMKLIEMYGAEFRRSINEFEAEYGRVPSADDLIYLAGLHTGKNPREVAQRIISELGDPKVTSQEKPSQIEREATLTEAEQLELLPSAPLKEIGERAQKILDAGEKVKDIIKPMLSITTRIKEIAPRVQMAIRRADQKVHDIITANTKQSEPFIQSVKATEKGMDATEKAKFHSEILNGDWTALEARGVKGVTEIRQMFTKTADSMGIASIENYFRRRVKDHDGLVKHFGENPKGEFKRALDDATKKKGRPLNKKEKSQAILGVLRSGKGDGLSKKRTIETVTPEMAQFYENPLKELSNYIRATAQSISRKEELGIEPVLSDELSDVDDSISEESVASIISDMVGDDQLSVKDESELKELLKSRLGFKGSGKAISAYRRLVSLKHVTKIKTVVKQFGDYFVGIGENKIDGIAPVNEIQNWKDELGREVEGNLQEVGVNPLDIELQDHGSKWLEDMAFKPLSMADIAGKTVLLRGTMRRWRRLSKSNPEKLSKILMDKFDHQSFVDKIISDMKTDTMTADVRFALFSQLADFHPVSHSEHIKAYIDNPKLRPLFVLKSFAFKRVDRLYRESIKFGIEGTSEFIAGKVDGNEAMADEGAHKVAKGVMGMSRFLVYSIAAEVVLEMTYAKIMRELGFKEEPEEPEDAMWTNMYMQELGKVIPFADPYAVEQAIERDDAWAFVEKIVKPAKPIGFDALKSLSKGLTDDDHGLSLDEYTTWKKDIPWLGEFLWGMEKAKEQ